MAPFFCLSSLQFRYKDNRHFMLKIRFLNAFILLAVILISGCNANRAQQSEESLKRLDDLYGYCDNPQRNIKGTDYEICIAKQRANSGEPLTTEDIATSLSGLFKRDEKIAGGASYSLVNSYLWQASLRVLTPFSIKIADNSGGYIETDWILDYNQTPDTRCQIKTIILSPELVSNGIEVAINCQNFDGQNWQGDRKEYLEEEKNLTLKILQTAASLNS